ncbi:MAG: hypothetical protein HW391_1579 [Chloroflexi bacterium]|nr:hypothetical protein [Chloroflexota bacterium]
MIAPPAGRASLAGPAAILGEGLTLIARNSHLLRRASIYLGLLTLAVAGPGVVAAISLFTWVGEIDLVELAESGSGAGDYASVIGRFGILMILAFFGIIVVAIEGTAVGILLLAGRVLDRPITLQVAVEQSRRVFWRLVRAGSIVAVVEAAVTLGWAYASGSMDGEESLGLLAPIPGTLAAMPFLYSSVAIVVAGDGARGSLRRSIRVARRAQRLTLALAGFALVTGVIEGFALSSGLDLIGRFTEFVHLDPAAGGLSLYLGAALALALVMAVGSLIFTVAAIVSAPQVIAWTRLGEPTGGLPFEPELVPAGVSEPEPEPDAPIATEPEPGVSDAPQDDDADQASGIPPIVGIVPAPSAWNRTESFRRGVTIPMRFVVAVMWGGAVLIVIGGPPA